MTMTPTLLNGAKPMDSEIKAKWLEALRSGRYAQGRQGLRNYNDEFCCLGVLCDAVAPDGWDKWQYHDAHDLWNHNGAVGYPTNDLLQAVGMSRPTSEHLGQYNDCGASFTEIADVIERNL